MRGRRAQWILVALGLLILLPSRALGHCDGMDGPVVKAALKTLAALQPPDAVLIGPSQLRSVSAQFARQSRGEVLYFNVCLLMFRPQALFDTLLRPAIENERVTFIQFVLDESEKQRWGDDVMPKVKACNGSEKVRPPIWCPLHESVSFIMAEKEPEGKTEVLLSFWGEPFMAHTTERDVPRYLFHVQSHSELVARLGELERNYRMGR
jgi:hypothetical protein